MKIRLLAITATILLFGATTYGWAMSQYPPRMGAEPIPILLPVLLTPDATISLEQQRLELLRDDSSVLNGEILLRNSGSVPQVFQVGFPVVYPMKDYPKQLSRLARDGIDISQREQLIIAPVPNYSSYKGEVLTTEYPVDAMGYSAQWTSLWMADYWQSVVNCQPYLPVTLAADQPLEGTTYTLTAIRDGVEAIVSCDPSQTQLIIDTDETMFPRKEEGIASLCIDSVRRPSREGSKNTCSFTLYWQGVPPEVSIDYGGDVDETSPAYRLEQEPAPTTTLAQQVHKQLLVYDNPDTSWIDPYAEELAYRYVDKVFAEDGMLPLTHISFSYRSLRVTVIRVIDISLAPGETTSLAWSNKHVRFGFDQTLNRGKTLYYSVIDRSPMSLWQQLGDTTVVLDLGSRTSNIVIDGAPSRKKIGNVCEETIDNTSSKALFISWQAPTPNPYSLSTSLFSLGLIAIAYWPLTLFIIGSIVYIVWHYTRNRRA